jgi:hypothetical protein
VRVIYITGAAHSGSTLLELMLNAHPEIVSVGEVANLNSVIKIDERGRPKFARCSCSAPSIQRCPFWSSVDKSIQRIGGKRLWDLDLQDYDSYDTQHAPNLLLFRAISEVSGKKFVVDSSKTPRRLSHLMRFKEFNVYPIHLTRDPKGQVNSAIPKHGLLKSILRHEIVYAQVRRILKGCPHTAVRYEDLARHPAKTLQSVLEPLGLAFHPQQLAWAEQVKHGAAGNHMRFQERSELILDERWNSELSRTQKLVISIATLRSRFGKH